MLDEVDYAERASRLYMEFKIVIVIKELILADPRVFLGGLTPR